MWDNGDHAAGGSTLGGTGFIPPLCVTLGADHDDTPNVVGQLSRIVSARRSGVAAENPLHMLYFNIGNGVLAAQMADAIASPLRISGTESDAAAMEEARRVLVGKSVLGALHDLDPSNSPAMALRNKFGCVGGADLLVYAHGAYPGRLPQFKLSRMVERLGDLTSRNGAIVTLHNHGPSDVDTIKKSVLGLPNFSAPGLNCNTQHKLENAFGEAKLYSFSVIVPNYMELPANLVALEAIFERQEMQLEGKDADDAEILLQTLQKVAGGKEALQETLQGLDSLSLRFFKERIAETGGKSLPITVGGGQMVMAFHSLEMAQEAFAAMRDATRSMDIPPILLPIHREVSPHFDKHASYGEWKVTLQKRGIVEPPIVAQIAAQNRSAARM
ncbi:MAG: hypothetical protein FJX23_10650 [Alphaproteobacteria bacterium]|nr:hypothetical protein [Alphaproteobacteria bacterium]